MKTQLVALALLALAGCATPPPAVVELVAPPPAPAIEKTVEHEPPPATEPKEIRIVAVGDIMLGGSAAPELELRGYDYPFVATRRFFEGAHVVFGNLEGPLTGGGAAVHNKQYLFRSPPQKVAPALARAGFNMLSLANNHILDYGLDGLRDTLAALDRAGIRYAGAGMDLSAARRPAVLEVAGGVRVAMLAYSLTFPEEFWAGANRPGTAFGHEAHVRADVTAARAQADIVLVSFHWGREGTTALRDYQPLLGRAAIEAGAQAVLGHHPHVLQAVERYRDGVILYSLGNYVFGSYSEIAARSAIAELTFRDGRFAALRLIPINVKNAEVVFQPRPLADREADEVIAHLQRLSAELGTVLAARDGAAVLEVSPLAQQ